ERCRPGDPGIADYPVEAAERRDRIVDQPCRHAGIGEIAGETDRAAAGIPDFGDQGFEFIGVGGATGRDGGAVRRQAETDGAPDAAARPGYEDAHGGSLQASAQASAADREEGSGPATAP